MMTWLSRLLPQSPSLRLADHNLDRRNRQAGRRRRMSTLESLEGRTLLSNITATQNGADVVTITGDTHNDQFLVTVNTNNTITVVGTGTPIKTQVNSHAVGVAWTSSFPASGLIINLPGTGNNFDNVLVEGQGQTVHNGAQVHRGQCDRHSCPRNHRERHQDRLGPGQLHPEGRYRDRRRWPAQCRNQPTTSSPH